MGLIECGGSVNMAIMPIEERQMRPHLRFTMGSLLFVIFQIAFVCAAYTRGNFLFGARAGVGYAFVAILIDALVYIILFRSQISKIKLAILLLFVLPVTVHFAFPTLLDPDAKYFIADQAMDRNAQSELKKLFASDPAFAELAVSTTHRKVVWFDIHGSIQSQADLDRLRTRVLGVLPSVDPHFIHFEVHVREDSRTFAGSGEEVEQWHNQAVNPSRR